MAHQAVNGNWTRAYAYNEASLIEPGKQSNRLSQTALQTGANPPVEPYAYDAHGNMTRMPHLPMMQWNFKDELSASSRQVAKWRGSDDLLRLRCGRAAGAEGSRRPEWREKKRALLSRWV